MPRLLRVGTDCSGVDAPIVALKAMKIPHRHVFSSDIDKHCIAMIKANCNPDVLFGDPEGPFPSGDIMNRKMKDVPDIDLYIAGFPCQPFSGANTHGSRGFDHKSGFVFDGCYKVIQKKQPKYFILENVKGILAKTCAEEWEYIQSKLNRLRTVYNIDWQVLNTQHYGIPQNRERLYIVGVKKPNTFAFPERRTLYTKENTSLKKYIDYTDTRPETNITNIMRTKLAKTENKPVVFIDLTTINLSGVINQAVRCPCLITSGTLWCVPLRRFATVKEYLKIQGFPISQSKFKIVVSDNQIKRQMGNTMSVNVLKAVFKELL
jgi:DNA (cytosine-5)-methyltransferase 1